MISAVLLSLRTYSKILGRIKEKLPKQLVPLIQRRWLAGISKCKGILDDALEKDRPKLSPPMRRYFVEAYRDNFITQENIALMVTRRENDCVEKEINFWMIIITKLEELCAQIKEEKAKAELSQQTDPKEKSVPQQDMPKKIKPIGSSIIIEEEGFV